MEAQFATGNRLEYPTHMAYHLIYEENRLYSI